MSLLIEDSPRNLHKWVQESVTAGLAQGGVVTPWATPWLTHDGAGRKPNAQTIIGNLHAANVEVWFDPMTHSLQMPGVGDMRYYDEYDLWGGPRGDLSDPALIEEHVARVFACQDSLGVPHLAPTVLLNTGLDHMSVLALAVAREAIRLDPDCRLSVAGTVSFWASGAALDAHIGALDSFAPAGWFLTVVRTATPLPVQAVAEEVHGLCRTSRSLSQEVPVHISHGDLAGLPAIAAGATSVGTGWDQRQRVCSMTDYAARSALSDGGGWYQRVTFPALLGSLSRTEATVMDTNDAALAASVGALPPPGVREAFDHHLSVMSDLLDELLAETDLRDRYELLLGWYDQAQAFWPRVQATTGCTCAAPEWIDRLKQGLELYGQTEGW